MSTRTFCRHTLTFATKACCARTLFKAKFLFGLVLNTLPAESETYNALVVMVCSGERSTRSTQHITERDTAQTECILTRLVITARPDCRSVSSHEKRNNIAQHPCIASVPSCVVEPRVARTLPVVPEPTLRADIEYLHDFATESFWTNVHTMESSRTRLACCRGAHGPWHGIGNVVFIAVLLCVCSTFSSCVFFFFASGVILELQAVLLGWSIRSASTHHLSAAIAQCRERWVPLPLSASCLLLLKRSRE